jgi:hypothetical protein
MWITFLKFRVLIREQVKEKPDLLGFFGLW